MQQPRQVRRAVLLIEMEDGLQYGFQVAGPTVDATITFDPPDTDPRWPYYERVDAARYGEIRARGVMTTMTRMPADVFDDHAEINPTRPEIGPA